LKVFDEPLEDQQVAGPSMIRELEIESHPHEFPALFGEVLQMVVQHSRVEPTIHARQVPEVDRVLDLRIPVRFYY
jgi:hypothetical protein